MVLNCRKKSAKSTAKLEKLIVKPGEEKNYHPVEPVEDYRTEAEKRFDERLKQKVGHWNRCDGQEKDFIEKRSKMSYQEVVDVWLGTGNDVQEMNAKLEKLTDHNDIPRIAAAGLG